MEAMSERISGPELEALVAHAEACFVLSPDITLRLVAEVRRLRALIVSAEANRPLCQECGGIPKALEAEAEAIRDERP